MEEDPVLAQEKQPGDDVAGSGFGLEFGEGFGGAGAVSGAVLPDWAKEAGRLVFAADGGSQLHDGLVEIAWLAWVDEVAGNRFKVASGAGLGIDGGAKIGQAGEDADDIAVNDRFGAAEGDAGDGGGGVGTDSREGAPIGGLLGNAVLGEGLGEAVEIAGARIVAQALPLVKDGGFGGGGEGLKVGKRLQPSVEVGQDGLDAGLLEHKLGKDRFVEGRPGAPWQRAGLFLVPCEELVSKDCGIIQHALGGMRIGGRNSNQKGKAANWNRIRRGPIRIRGRRGAL